MVNEKQLTSWPAWQPVVRADSPIIYSFEAYSFMSLRSESESRSVEWR